MQTILLYTNDYIGKSEMSEVKNCLCFGRNVKDLFYIVERTFIELEQALVRAKVEMN